MKIRKLVQFSATAMPTTLFIIRVRVLFVYRCVQISDICTQKCFNALCFVQKACPRDIVSALASLETNTLPSGTFCTQNRDDIPFYSPTVVVQASICNCVFKEQHIAHITRAISESSMDIRGQNI